MKNFGFTLAEVLITLGIIGIVAAMTLSTLINSYKKQIAKNQFKNTYSILTTAFNAAIYERGGNFECVVENTSAFQGNNPECKDFWENYFLKQLKVVKYCESDAYANGCVPDYKDEDFPYSSGCGGFTAEQIKYNKPAAVLNDGTIVFPYTYNLTKFYPAIGFDINGFKGPNKGGYDVFSLGISLKGNHPILGGWNNGNLSYCLPMVRGMYFKYLHDVLAK